MTMLPVALTIAGAAALLNLWLGLRVSLLRRRHGVALGSGGNPAVEARMRAHANFAEYAPMFLILLLLVELAGAPAGWLWAAGILFVLARLLHPFGMDRPGANALRAAGIIGTWAALLGLAVAALALPYTARSEAPALSYASAASGTKPS